MYSDGQQDTDKLLRQRSLLKELREGPVGEGNLTKNAAKQIFLELAKQNEDKWKLGPSGMEAFAACCQGSLRAMLRDVQQAVIKSKTRGTPKWLSTLLDLEQSMPEEMTSTNASASPEEPASTDIETKWICKGDEGHTYMCVCVHNVYIYIYIY